MLRFPLLACLSFRVGEVLRRGFVEKSRCLTTRRDAGQSLTTATKEISSGLKVGPASMVKQRAIELLTLLCFSL